MSAILFLILGTIAVGFAIALVLSRNAVHGALCLVANFAALAVFFLLLSAEFIAVVQVAVYAGAIMVLFLFVIMLLNMTGAEEALSEKPKVQLATAFVIAALLISEVAFISTRAIGLATQMPVKVHSNFGAPSYIGLMLYSKYLVPFEITSLILLAAMVGAVVLAKRRLA